VAKVVKTNARHPSSQKYALIRPSKGGDCDGPSHGVREDKIRTRFGPVPKGAGGQAILCLAGALSPQCDDGHLNERKTPLLARSAFRGRIDRIWRGLITQGAPRGPGPGPQHTVLTPLEIDVGPSKAEQLSSTTASGECQDPNRSEAVPTSGDQELASFILVKSRDIGLRSSGHRD